MSKVLFHFILFHYFIFVIKIKNKDPNYKLKLQEVMKETSHDVSYKYMIFI